MNRHLTSLAAVLLATAVAPAVSAASRIGEASPDITAGRQVQAHTSFLADDLLEGRDTGSSGYALAARYVAAQFARLGLAPAGDNGRYEQKVRLISATDTLEAGRFIVRRPGVSDEIFVAGTDMLARVSPGQTAGDLTAPAVYVGYGVSAPEVGHDDLRDVDLNGRIAVVLSGAPRQLMPDARAHYAMEKAKTLAARGAVGVITVITPRDLALYPWAFAVAQSRFSRMRLLDRDGGIVDGYPQLKVGATLSTAAAQRLFAGTDHDAEALFAAAERGESKRFALGAEISLAAAATTQPIDSSNVLGLLPGTDPALADTPIVVTAHLDHLGIGPAVDGDTIYNGAMDNAIGTAMLLVLAEQLASLPPLRRSVLFAAVTAEEKGLLGALHLSRNPPEGVRRFAANLNFDMALFPVPTREVIAWGAPHSTLAETLAGCAARQEFVVLPDPIPDEAIFVRSDQYAFVKQGVPSVFLSAWPTRDPAGGEDPSGAFLKKRYHKPNDDLNQPIDWPSTGAFMRLANDLIRTMGDASERPSWLPGNFFGVTFAGDAEP